MADWANFFLYMISSAVTTLFNLDLGVGFSLGDAEIALFVIGLIASGFIIRFGYGISSNYLRSEQKKFYTKSVIRGSHEKNNS